MTTPLRLPDGGIIFPGTDVTLTNETIKKISSTRKMANNVAAFAYKVKRYAGGPKGDPNFTATP